MGDDADKARADGLNQGTKTRPWLAPATQRRWAGSVGGRIRSQGRRVGRAIRGSRDAGGGDLDMVHSVLERIVTGVRKELIGTLR